MCGCNCNHLGERVVDQLGTPARPLRVAIIGAGPSGFYTAGSLLQQKELQVQIDMFDRLPTPHGLVRYGVAPDHQKIKAVIKVFDRTASDPRFRFFGNVALGSAITHADLRLHYDQIVYAVGAQADRKLNIPGEGLAGSLSATEFVAWYNGHPDFADLMVDLSGKSAVVVGVGNVAMDVARILAKQPEELQNTDIADYALEQLTASQIEDIYILARRGPVQVKFTPPELKEIGELANADVVVDPAELVLDPASTEALAQDTEAQKNLELLQSFATRPLSGKARRIHFRFLVSPVELVGQDGKVAAVRLEHNELQSDAQGSLNAVGTGEFATLPANLVLRSVGYKGTPLADVPYDNRTGIIPNDGGRVKDPTSSALIPGEYVVGWAKRGPTGIIGTNRPDAAETVAAMLADLPTITPAAEPDPAAIDALFTARNIPFVDNDDWRALDAIEIANGAALGKPRRKFTQVQEMLAAIQGA